MWMVCIPSYNSCFHGHYCKINPKNKTKQKKGEGRVREEVLIFKALAVLQLAKLALQTMR